MKNKIELLAPAGSYECLLAALKSGADAVYVGGDKFGARAFAGNFNEEELKSAIDLMHLHGKKLFLTINTLLKEKELNKELYDYIYPYYIHGLDAVIVQDLGVLMFVKEHFPDLPIHASTQMTVTSTLGAKFLEELGVERVVTSRELSLKEVQEITTSTTLEVESFVHGALCYAYSGQCIYSSIIGGRSGNRGQCAQPCRLPYKVDGKTGHYMSLKDICTLEHIDKLIESGVYSFKIEGRMKKPEYVASVTSMYRKYIDIYEKTGSVNVSTKDMDILRDVFSRGEFTTGYWLQKNGPEMVTFDKPSHTGVPILKALKQEGRNLLVEVIKPLNKGDIIDIPGSSDNYTFGTDYSVGQKFELSLRKGTKVTSGAILYRTRNNSVIDKIHENLSNNKLQQEILGSANFILGEASELTLTLGDVSVTVFGAVVDAAQNQSANVEQVRKQLNKMGTTPFIWGKLDISLKDGLFLPVQQLKDLRRKGVIALDEAIVSAYRRDTKVVEYKLDEFIHTECNVTKYSLSIETLEQLEVVSQGHNFDRIYINYELMESLDQSRLNTYIEKLCVPVYIALPHIIRQKYLKVFSKLMEQISKLNVKGVLIRNIEEYQLLTEISFQGDILLDNHLHVFNRYAQKFWLERDVQTMSYSAELTGDECGDLYNKNMELTVYGYPTVMVSAQCIKKTTSGCTHKGDIVKLNDRMKVDFTARSCCSYCHNLIYHYEPTSLYQENAAVDKINPAFKRVSLTIENSNQTKTVLDEFIKYKSGIDVSIDNTSIGNFKRGIR